MIIRPIDDPELEEYCRNTTFSEWGFEFRNCLFRYIHTPTAFESGWFNVDRLNEGFKDIISRKFPEVFL